MATILITGASSGIGEAAALLLAEHHAVTATVRSEAAKAALLEAARTAGVSLAVSLLDVCDRKAISALMAAFDETTGIDVLVHNAGAGFFGTLEQLELSELRRALEVNFFGAAQVIQAVLPGMRRRGGGKIIATSSVGAVIGRPFSDAYCASKFALEGLLESLAPVAATVGISVSVVEPGPVATKFLANVEGLEELLRHDPLDPYGRAKANYTDHLGIPDHIEGAQAPEEIAEVIAAVIAETTPAFRYQTSQSSTAFVATKLTDVSGTAVMEMTSAWVAD
jgi:NAD(P)-dependent dehydrogenase (short-subunit alcohol dehydrogenase family)